MKKGISALLSIILSASVFFGCTDNRKDNSDSTSQNSSQTESTESQVKQQESIGLPDINWEGQTVTVLSVDPSRHYYGSVQFVPNDELIGNVINDTVDLRNSIIEEKYGIKIETVAVNYPKDMVAEIVQSSNDEYDLICDGVTWMAQLVLSDYF